MIQVNTDLPITIDRAIDLACHEGYPGHHVYNASLEKALVRDRGWPEFSVYALFSPQSLVAEGSANHGVAVAFPGAERVAFERATLFPLATVAAADEANAGALARRGAARGLTVETVTVDRPEAFVDADVYLLGGTGRGGVQALVAWAPGATPRQQPRRSSAAAWRSQGTPDAASQPIPSRWSTTARRSCPRAPSA